MTETIERQTTALSRETVTQWAQDLYDNSVDRKDADGFAAAFVPNGTLQFANNPQLTGRDAIREAIAQFFSAFVSLKHKTAAMHVDGDTLIIEAIVSYVRHDGGKVTVPAVTIYRLSSDARGRAQAEECRIYVDLAPLFAATAV